jgi:hypothetical protein
MNTPTVSPTPTPASRSRWATPLAAFPHDGRAFGLAAEQCVDGVEAAAGEPRGPRDAVVDVEHVGVGHAELDVEPSHDLAPKPRRLFDGFFKQKIKIVGHVLRRHEPAEIRGGDVAREPDGLAHVTT